MWGFTVCSFHHMMISNGSFWNYGIRPQVPCSPFSGKNEARTFYKFNASFIKDLASKMVPTNEKLAYLSRSNVP